MQISQRVDDYVGLSYVDVHEFMLIGYKVRRESWPKNLYIYLSRGRLCSADRGKKLKCGISHDLYDYDNVIGYSVMPRIMENSGKYNRVWRPTMVCLLSRDWVVITSDTNENTISRAV